jgi:DNA-binding transcriptional ArsR family regulator
MMIHGSEAPARHPLDLKFAALADPTRRAILVRLARGEATVSDLGKPFRISQPAISRHLKILEAAGLIESGQAAQTRPRRLRHEAFQETTEWFEQIRAMWSDSFDRLETLLDEMQKPK